MTVASTADTPRCRAGDARLRVVLLLDIRDGAQQRFLQAYERFSRRVAAVPGHISHQLCQSGDDPGQWLITSEWESAESYLTWLNSEERVGMVEPMHACVRGTRPLRYSIVRESRSTPSRGARSRAAASLGRRARRSRADGGLVRHALTFTVKPGSEQAVARILAGYATPAAKVDAATRLHRTSLLMRGNRVVRVIEVFGDLGAALRHISAQPAVRAVEEALNPYLEEDRDLDDPDSAGRFFMRAALPAVRHLTADPGSAGDPRQVRRRALIYPAGPGCGAAVARWLARQDELVAARPSSPLVGSTVFQRDDTVVRVVDLRPSPEPEHAVVLGIAGRRAPAVLSRLVDLGRDGDLTGETGIKRLLTECDMSLLTDRRAHRG